MKVEVSNPMNEFALATERTTRSAVRQLLLAVDECQDLLKCTRLQEESTCLHRVRRFAEERLCRSCRLVSAVEELERLSF
jgi:hypothetical protein